MHVHVCSLEIQTELASFTISDKSYSGENFYSFHEFSTNHRVYVNFPTDFISVILSTNICAKCCIKAKTVKVFPALHKFN